MIIGCVGPEGGGKSATLAWLARMHDAQGLPVYAFPGFDVYRPRKGQERVKITTTIKPQDWVDLGPQFDGGMILIDEIQQFFGAEQWNSLMGRLFGWVAMQRRKRGLIIAYTVQNDMWVNNRIRWLTHVAIHCRDLYWTPWGKEQRLERGALSHLTYVDNKGLFGQEGQVMAQQNLRTKELWESFDSFAVINVWEGMTQVVIKGKPRVEIELGPGGLRQTTADDLPEEIVDIAALSRGQFD